MYKIMTNCNLGYTNHSDFGYIYTLPDIQANIRHPRPNGSFTNRQVAQLGIDWEKQTGIVAKKYINVHLSVGVDRQKFYFHKEFYKYLLNKFGRLQCTTN